MKTLLKMMVFISIFVSITSCSNENTLENMLPAENKVHSDSFRFRYQGVEYTAEYELQDSTIVFINPEIGNMLSKLNNNPNTSTLTYSNGTIEYFDSTKELELFVEEKFQRSDNAQTRLSMAYLTSITLKVYEHKDFGGEVLTYNGPIEVPNMKNAYNYGVPMIPKDFNDIITSFKLTGSRRVGTPENAEMSAIVIFYRDSNYKSSSKAFILNVDHQEISHTNFKKIDFNDKVSSFKLYKVRDPYPKL